jgi:hypothetical protein
MMDQAKEIDLQLIDLLLHKVEAEALEVVGRVMEMQKEVSAALERIEAGRASDPKKN